jgi:hypothetical protein
MRFKTKRLTPLFVVVVALALLSIKKMKNDYYFSIYLEYLTQF